MEYLKYKANYLKIRNMESIDLIGGQRMKKILYDNGNLIVQNNIDSDVLGMDSTFLIGSITKIFTIFVILILHRNQLLDIDDPIIRYIESKNKDNNDNFKKVTILDIVNHTSGLRGMPSNHLSIYTRHKTACSCMKTFIDDDLFTNAYGTDNYSNIGYIVLGCIIERVTGSTYIDAYKRYIFDPLHMKNTDIGETTIRLYSENCKKIKKRENNFRYWGLSAGGLYSCVSDLLLFAEKSFQLLDKRTIDILINRTYIGSMNSDRGKIGHSGKIFGAHTRFYFTPGVDELEKIYIECNTCVSIKKEIDEYYESELKKTKQNDQTGGAKKDLQFILFGDVMTGHQVWSHDQNSNKIDFVKKLKKLGSVVILKPNYVNFMNYSKIKGLGNWFYKSGIKNIGFKIEDLHFENYAKWVYDQIDPNKKFIAIGLDQGCHFAKYFCNRYPDNCIGLYILIDRNFTKKSYEKTFHSDMNYDFIRSIVGDDYKKYIIENLTNNTISKLLNKIKQTGDEPSIQLLNGLCKGIIRSQYDRIKEMKVKTIIYSDSNTLTPEKLQENHELNKQSNNLIIYYYIVVDPESTIPGKNSEYLIHGKYKDELLNNIYGLVRSSKL